MISERCAGRDFEVFLPSNPPCPEGPVGQYLLYLYTDNMCYINRRKT